jgi:predicted phage replisome organizer
MFDNRKIKQIEVAPKGKQMLLLWVRLICLAGAINDGGLVYVTAGVPYTLDGLAVELKESKALVKKALDLFQSFNMVSYDSNNCLLLNGWEEHQNVTGLERIREQNRLRKQKQRERDKSQNVTEENCASHEMSRDVHTEITQQNKNKNKNKNKNNITTTTTTNSILTGGQYVNGNPAVVAAAEAIKFWSDNTGQFGEVIKSDIADLVAQYGNTFVIEAMKQSIRQNKLKISYVIGAAKGMASGEDTRKSRQEYIDPFEAMFGKDSNGEGDGENGSN